MAKNINYLKVVNNILLSGVIAIANIECLCLNGKCTGDLNSGNFQRVTCPNSPAVNA